MHKIYLTVISLMLLTGGNICKAETQTAEELCRQRNSASCEISGLKFFIEDDCPKGAKVLRPKGKERCDQPGVNAGAAASSAVAIPATAELALPTAHASTPEKSAGFFGYIFFVLAAIGFMQGLSTRAGLWPMVFVAVILPLLTTSAILADTFSPALSGEYLVYAGKEFLWHALFSVSGWLLGSALHYGVLRHLANRAKRGQ